jgi:hypothetical protein
VRFSWKALLLAPLAVPAITGVLFAGGAGAKALPAFLIVAAFMAALSYGATVGMLLPAVFVAGRLVRLTVMRIGFIGAVLGVVLCVPVTWFTWKSTGPDSGPPTEPYFVWLVRWGVGWCWPCVAGGAVNGLLYGWLTRPAPAANQPSAAPSVASPPAA